MGRSSGSGYDYSDDGRGSPNTGPLGETIQETISQGDEIDEAYQNFVDETQLTDLQGETISNRRDVLEEILREEIGVTDSQLIGSFTRETVVGPMSQDTDADMMVVLDADQHRQWIMQENGPRNCLRAIKRRIEDDPRFSETNVSIDQNAVCVQYHDSTIEIVPAFDYNQVPHAEDPSQGLNPFDSQNDGYAIPDTHGQQSWVGTNPRRYKQQFEARNDAHNGKVAGLARSMKTWANNNNVPVRGYTMEVMVYNYFANKSKTGARVPDNYHDLASDFVESLPNRMQQTTREPIYNEPVDSGMSQAERQEAVQKAEKAAEALKTAQRLKEEGRTKAAKERLREVYGDGFSNK
ncbi:CBASS oligonucleotide cyclase [Halorubrum miltondacostae]|uniref:CBASS oligonucleotide cyclase n=1 Tax=Halorubrum miltondacostae TaxID=3076378 RepID=A0ABD5M753_9EURY